MVSSLCSKIAINIFKFKKGECKPMNNFNFVFSRFEASLKECDINMDYTQSLDGNYILRLSDLPPELDISLLKLQFNVTEEYKEAKENGRPYIRTSKYLCCLPTPDSTNDDMSVNIVLDPTDPSAFTKMNIVDCTIKEYFRDKNNKKSFI